MATQDYPSFDQETIQQALDAAKAHSDVQRAEMSTEALELSDGAMLFGGGCISVTVKNHKVCINLPLGIGSKCFAVPSWVPEGQAVQACINICTKWHVPCGVELTVSFAGKLVFKKGFGCSC